MLLEWIDCFGEEAENVIGERDRFSQNERCAVVVFVGLKPLGGLATCKCSEKGTVAEAELINLATNNLN